MKCSACGAVNAQSQRFCGNCGRRLDSAPIAERRQVTVVFCDLVGSTALSQSHDAEDLREIISSYQTLCGQAVSRHGGHVAQYLGDGVLIYFGFPVAHEDDASRAIRCGLEILASLERIVRQPRLQVRLGADTGSVVISTLGAGSTQEDLALGDVPNVAARVQSLAQPGTMAVSDRTWQLVKGFFKAESLGEQLLKGIDRPVPVWRVLAPSGAKTRLDAAQALSPYVGRDAELAQLEAFVHDSEAAVRIVDIVGEPGIGKSRLLHELLGRLRDTGVTV